MDRFQLVIFRAKHKHNRIKSLKINQARRNNWFWHASDLSVFVARAQKQYPKLILVPGFKYTRRSSFPVTKSYSEPLPHPLTSLLTITFLACPRPLKTLSKGAHYQVTRIMLHQGNRRILVQTRFTGFLWCTVIRFILYHWFEVIQIIQKARTLTDLHTLLLLWWSVGAMN